MAEPLHTVQHLSHEAQRRKTMPQGYYQHPFVPSLIRQYDRILAKIHLPFLRNPPIMGWIKTIREAEGKVTILLLRQAAAALDCDFFYVLKPRTSLANRYKMNRPRRLRNAATPRARRAAMNR